MHSSVLMLMQRLTEDHDLRPGVMLLTQAKDLVAQLLVVDPSQRLSAKEALAHPWIQASVLLQDCTQLHLQS